ncbi:MAG: TetR family transcriptional regulator [Phycisphaerales bacterium]|nr:TetR family transcriptional regulator [Phycisphaerales bacterium]
MSLFVKSISVVVDTETRTMARGRPREFDTEQALDSALALFWRNGYEGTSLAALTDAVGVTPTSLYAAFGNKEALFKRVVDRYIQGPANYLLRAVAEPTARGVAEAALAGAIGMVMNPKHPDGCLLVHGALAAHPDLAPIREELSRRRAGAEAAVRQRFRRAAEDGELPGTADADRLAGFLMTVIWGMSVQAAGGAGRADLERAAETALSAWPGVPARAGRRRRTGGSGPRRSAGSKRRGV